MPNNDRECLVNYNNDLEYNEDMAILRYPQGPYSWSIYFSVTVEEDARVIKCLLPREVVEDHFHDNLEEFDIRAMAKVKELMKEEILPIVFKAIKNSRMKKQDRGRGSYLEIELNVDDFEAKDFRR